MNKYNKHKIELGRYLPSWVKYGTLAFGVGACIEIGDQSTAYAGNYRVECKMNGDTKEVVFAAADLEAGVMAEVGCWSNKRHVVRFGKEEDVLKRFQCNEECFSCYVGSFVFCFNFKDDALYLYGGSCSDALCVESAKAVRLSKARKTHASVLVFEGVPVVRVDGLLSSSTVAFVRCKDVVIASCGILSVDSGAFASETRIKNSGTLKCGAFFPYGDWSASGTGKTDICGCGKIKDRFAFKNFDSSLEAGCFAEKDPFDYWYPFDNKGELPFFDSNGASVKKDGDKWFYEVRANGTNGEYCFVLVVELMDGCGARHAKRICFSVEDREGNVLGKTVQRIKEGGNWTRVICPLELKLSCNQKISFKLDNDDGISHAPSMVNYRECPMVLCFRKSN